MGKKSGGKVNEGEKRPLILGRINFLGKTIVVPNFRVISDPSFIVVCKFNQHSLSQSHKILDLAPLNCFKSSLNSITILS